MAIVSGKQRIWYRIEPINALEKMVLKNDQKVNEYFNYFKNMIVFFYIYFEEVISYEKENR